MASFLFLQDLINSIELFKPEIVLIITLIVAVFVDVIFKKHQLAAGYLTFAGLIITAITLCTYGMPQSANFAFSKMLSVDPFSQFFKLLIVIGSLITVCMTFSSKELLHSKNSVGE